MIILIFLVLLVPFVVGGILTLATQELEKNKKNKTYIDKLMEDKEFRKRFDEEYQNLCKTESMSKKWSIIDEIDKFYNKLWKLHNEGALNSFDDKIAVNILNARDEMEKIIRREHE